MKIVNDEIWLCTDCYIIAETGDASSLDYYFGPDETASEMADQMWATYPSLFTS